MTVLFPAYACVWLYRVSHYFHERRRARLARFIWNLNVLVTGADLSVSADVGGGLVIPHPAGVSISGTAGRNLTVMALAGIGGEVTGSADGPEPGLPALGDDVSLAHRAGIRGPVRIGDGVRISAGCIVTTDVEAGVTIGVPPLRIHQKPVA